MLEALYERGITPDLIVGTSVGAINGAFVAGRPQTVATAHELGAASAAIPGVFEPVAWGDTDLIDGGVANNTSISHAIQLGAHDDLRPADG